MSKSQFGIDNLIDKLKNLFYLHLKQFLPAIYDDLLKKKNESNKILESLGDMSFPDNPIMTSNSMVYKFSDNIEKIFGGKLGEDSEVNILPKLKEKHSDFLKEYRNQYKPSAFLNVFITH